ICARSTGTTPTPFIGWAYRGDPRMSPSDRPLAEAERTETPDAFDALIASGRKPVTPRGLGGETGRRQPISEQVANRILSMVRSGNLKPGDRLPTEQQMSIALSISRPPLREALKALTLMGIVESRQGGRYTVTDLSPSRLVGPFNSILTFADYDVQE